MTAASKYKPVQAEVERLREDNEDLRLKLAHSEKKRTTAESALTRLVVAAETSGVAQDPRVQKAFEDARKTQITLRD